MLFHKVVIIHLCGWAAAATLPLRQEPLMVENDYRIPTKHESAIMARRMLRLGSIGTISTVFPTSRTPEILEDRPSDVQGKPIGLMEYFGDCERDTANPTILAVDIATSIRNSAAGSNVSLSIRWDPPSPGFYPSALPRFSLIGYLEDMSDDDVKRNGIEKCYVEHHPEARLWTPGNDIHSSRWARLVVEHVYWFGGYGDRAYIGWISAEDWRSVTEKEIEKCRLAGEDS